MHCVLAFFLSKIIIMFNNLIFGHPQGLFVLFFTEMWERFSYYGMRALLVMFLVSSFGLEGWAWSRENAMALYGTYTSLVYITPIIGGYIADKFLGYRLAVILGALIMTLGHLSMAMEFSSIFLYIGLLLLILGNGLFKPNMTSIVSEMYKEHPQKKDAAYTIFYMGVNSGAFLGILLCGYIGEKVSWSYGFGLAGIFMLLGSLQFWFARGIFEHIGTKISKEIKTNNENSNIIYNVFTLKDKLLMYFSALAGVIYVINDPLQKVLKFKGLHFYFFNYQLNVIDLLVVLGLISFIYLLFSRILRYEKVLKERMFSIVFFAIFTIIFWMAFEQAGGSMTIFAKDYTNRIMKGDFAKIYFIVNALITIVPVAIITFVVFLLVRKTFKKYLISSLFLISSFVIIWSIVFWMLQRDFNSKTYVLSYQDNALVSQDVLYKKTQINEPISFNLNQEVTIMDIDQKGKFLYVDSLKYNKIITKEKDLEVKTKFITAKVVEIKNNEIEIPATWFLILNSLFIITFAPLFSKWWESRFNPDGAVKYALGLIFLGIGFGMLAFGSLSVPKGASMASLSMIWLIFAYLFHTLGELCLSPVALSYISKLVPSRMIAMMFGIWYVAVAIGNKLAGLLGGQIDKITAQFDLSTFFMIFTFIPISIGIIAILLNPIIKKWMHGVK